MNSIDLKDFGTNIKVARLNKKMTQESLAEKCDVSVKYISNLECREISL